MQINTSEKFNFKHNKNFMQTVSLSKNFAHKFEFKINLLNYS